MDEICTLWGPGVRRHGTGLQARVYVHGQRSVRHFPLEATRREIQEWREDERAQLRLDHAAVGRAPAGTFEADARRYLATVKALPTWKERRQHIQEWTEVFGRRPRRSIKPADIRAQRDRWLTAPRQRARRVNGTAVLKPLPPYAASSVNHRLRALRNLWTVLDGRRAYNPVAEVPEAQEPEAAPRALPYAVLDAIIKAMPDRGLATRGKPRPKRSLAKLRARVILETGLPPRLIGELGADDFAWLGDGCVRRPGRGKGRGTKGELVPVSTEGAKALRALANAGGLGRFNTGTICRAVQRAAAALRKKDVELPRVVAYDLRHGFVTDALLASRDFVTTQRLAGHTDPRTTRRYAAAALNPVARAALDQLEHLRRAMPKPRTSKEQRPGAFRRSGGPVK